MFLALFAEGRQENFRIVWPHSQWAQGQTQVLCRPSASAHNPRTDIPAEPRQVHGTDVLQQPYVGVTTVMNNYCCEALNLVRLQFSYELPVACSTQLT